MNLGQRFGENNLNLPPPVRKAEVNMNLDDRSRAGDPPAAAPSCGSAPRMPWLSESIRLNAPAGVRALYIPKGDAFIGGTLCVQELNLLGSAGGAMPFIIDWQDYALALVESANYTMGELIHARYRRLNDAVTIHVDLRVDVVGTIDSISATLPVETTSPLTRFATGMFDWTGPGGERGITVGRIQVGPDSTLVFYSPAFEPGSWHLCGQVEYEVS